MINNFNTMPSITKKTCIDCNQEKKLEHFNRRHGDSFYSYCRSCASSRTKKWAKENPERRRLNARESMQRRRQQDRESEERARKQKLDSVA